MVLCLSCEGSGYWNCDYCDGRGCGMCDGESTFCEECDGAGEVDDVLEEPWDD